MKDDQRQQQTTQGPKYLKILQAKTVNSFNSFEPLFTHTQT